MHPIDLPFVFDVLTAWTRQILPDKVPVEFLLRFEDGSRMRLPLPAPRSNGRPSQPVSPRAHHSADYRSVSWFGSNFTFSPTQSAIVHQLWEAWEEGTPDVGQATLTDGAGSEAGRLRDLFRDHPAWNTMITSVRRGAYRLQEAFIDPRTVLSSAMVPDVPLVDLPSANGNGRES